MPDFGIEPHVYIPENPTYPLIDENLVQEVSEKAIIVKQKIKEPYALASIFSNGKAKKISSGIIPEKKKQSLVEKAMLWVRGNLFIPDARVMWVKPSVKFLKNYIEENAIQTIITTGPPHSLHLIGLQLKKELNIHWIADFRDPWTTIGYHNKLKLSNWAAKKHKQLEKEVLTSCDEIIVTSPTTKKEFEGITSKSISVITNGYDVERVEKKAMDTKFTLAHIGSLLSERNPKILWEAINEVLEENEAIARLFELKLIGAVSEDVLLSIKESGLENFVNHIGYVSHERALQEQKCSQVLLLIEINSEETKCIIPGKVFEYIVSERPIIAIGPEKADFASIIKETNTGKFFTYDDKELIKKHILELFNAFLKDELKVHAVGLQKYSRKALTSELASVLK